MPLKHALRSDSLGGCLVRLMDAPALAVGLDMKYYVLRYFMKYQIHLLTKQKRSIILPTRTKFYSVNLVAFIYKLPRSVSRLPDHQGVLFKTNIFDYLNKTNSILTILFE